MLTLTYIQQSERYVSLTSTAQLLTVILQVHFMNEDVIVEAIADAVQVKLAAQSSQRTFTYQTLTPVGDTGSSNVLSKMRELSKGKGKGKQVPQPTSESEDEENVRSKGICFNTHCID